MLKPSFCVTFFLIIWRNCVLAEVTCDGKVYFIVGMDSSSSLNQQEYIKIRSYTATLTTRFKHKDMIATMVFARDVKVVTDFGNLSIPEIATYPHIAASQTRSDLLIRNMTAKLTDYENFDLDPDIPKVGLVVTDGRSTSIGTELSSAANMAATNNVHIIALGVSDSQNYSPRELLTMTNGIEEHVLEASFANLSNTVLDQTVEKICLLSQNGLVSAETISGDFYLSILVDVSEKNFELTKRYLKAFLKKIEFTSENSQLMITVGYSGPLGKFGKSSTQVEIEQFISNLDATSIGDFDPVLAFQRVENTIDKASPYASKVTVFITDKTINDFRKAKQFYESDVANKPGTLVHVGIGNDINVDHLTQLSFGEIINRIIVSETSLMSSGLNGIIRAIGQVVEKTPLQVYSGPAEVVIAAEYCPAPITTSKSSSFDNIADFLRKIVNYTENYPGKVELTALTYCKDVQYITSIKNHQITFHVTHGLHTAGVITRLQSSTSNVMREILNLYEHMDSKVKIAIVIVADDYMENELNALTREALMENIIVLPLGIATDNSEAIQLKLDSMGTAESVLVNISTLFTTGISMTKLFVEKHIDTGERTDIAISMSSLNLNDSSLSIIKHFIKLLRRVFTPLSATALRRKLDEDIGRSQALVLQQNHRKKVSNERNTHLALYEIHNKLSKFSGNRIGLIITNGVPSATDATLFMADKARKANITLFTMAYSVTPETIRFYQNMTDHNPDNVNILPDSSKAFMAVFSTGKKIVNAINPDVPTHIIIAVDSSNQVTGRDFENMKTSITNFLTMWSKTLNDVTYSIGVFAHRMKFVLENEGSILNQKNIQHLKHDKNVNNVLESSNLVIHEAINGMVQRMTSQTEQGDFNTIIIFTDRPPTDPVLTSMAISNAEEKDIHVVIVGVGDAVKMSTVHFDDSVVNGPPNFDKWTETIVSHFPIDKNNVMFGVAADYRSNNAVVNWMKRLTIKIFNTLFIQHDLLHFGFVTFKDHIVDIIKLQDPIKVTENIMKMNAFQSHGPGTARTDLAINAISQSYDFAMSDSSKALILVSEHGSYSSELTTAAVKQASEKGINLISIGVGSKVSDDELRMTSNYEVDRMQHTDSWDKLNDDALQFTVKKLHDIQPRHLLTSASRPSVDEPETSTSPTTSSQATSSQTTTSQTTSSQTTTKLPPTKDSTTTETTTETTTTPLTTAATTTTAASTTSDTDSTTTTVKNQPTTASHANHGIKTTQDNTHTNPTRVSTRIDHVHIQAVPTPEAKQDISSLDHKLYNEICAGCLIDDVKGFGYVPYKSDCSRYVQCYKDKFYVQDCILDLFWDQETLSCKHINDVKCAFDPCHTKPTGYRYTTERLLDVSNKQCNKYYKCDGTHTSQLCACEPVVERGQLIMQRYDDSIKHCVPDHQRECHHVVDGTYIPLEKPYQLCTKSPIPGQEDMYRDTKTQLEHKCDLGYTYQHRYCMCIESISKVNKTYECSPLVHYLFDAESPPAYALNNVKLHHDGFGYFDAHAGSYVPVDILANNYDTSFGAKITIQRSLSGNMHVMENCLKDPGPTLQVRLEEIRHTVFVVAELKSTTGMKRLEVPSLTLTDFKMATISLVSNSTHVALWVEDVNGNLDGLDDLAIDSELTLACQAQLVIGLGFTGKVDDFKWYKNCLPADLQKVFDDE